MNFKLTIAIVFTLIKIMPIYAKKKRKMEIVSQTLNLIFLKIYLQFTCNYIYRVISTVNYCLKIVFSSNFIKFDSDNMFFENFQVEYREKCI